MTSVLVSNVHNDNVVPIGDFAHGFVPRMFTVIGNDLEDH